MDIMIEKLMERCMPAGNPADRRILLKCRMYCEKVNLIYLAQDR
jgi:hypothetical protein